MADESDDSPVDTSSQLMESTSRSADSLRRRMDSNTKLARLRSKTLGEDGEVCLASSVYSNKLTETLFQYQQNRVHCDFSIRLSNGGEVSAHKMVLSAASKYFDCLFQAGMVETQQGYVTLDMKEETLQVLLKFMYVGKLMIRRDTICDLVDGASHLQIDGALRLGGHYLMHTLSKDNCVDVLQLAERYSLHSVAEQTQKFMRKMFVSMDSAQLERLSYGQLEELVQHSGLLCSTEFDVFSQVVAWLGKIPEDDPNKQLYALDLCKKIRFPLMSAEELVTKVPTLEFMKHPGCQALLSEAKDYHLVGWKQPCMQTTRTQVRHGDVQYMALCMVKDFFVFPIFSAGFKLQQEPIELRRPPRALSGPSVCVYNNFLYCCGGIHDQSAPHISSARCFRYDPRTDTWFEIASMNEARQRCRLEVVGDHMFALGGVDDHGSCDTYEVYSFAKNEWSIFSKPMGFHIANRYASISVAQSIYVCGGSIGTYTSNAMVQYVHDYNRKPGALIVRKLANMLVPRKRHRMLNHGTKLFVMGGQCSSVEVFDILTEQWTLYTGFHDTFGVSQSCLGVCSLDPTHTIFVFIKRSNVQVGGTKNQTQSALMVNLTKDPDTEQAKFVRKYDCKMKFPANISSFGCQIQLQVAPVFLRSESDAPRPDMPAEPQVA